MGMVLPPDYVLDFGHVVPGQVLTGVLNVTNSGSVPLSLSASTKCLAGTVKFNPQEAKLKMGHRSVLLPVQTSHGGRMQVQLCAVVTEPAVSISADTLQFDMLQCGMCQIKKMQLSNPGHVICHWKMAEEVKPVKKPDKFLPLYKRKKPQPRPVVFEMIPSSGTLSPGEEVDVQIKFCPTEGGTYSRQLVVCVTDSTQQMFVTACGEAEEPQLHFCPDVLDLGACLPASIEAEAEVTVKNPCSFPIEFYSLELDKQYLEEEKILQTIHGYDEKHEMLLPPIHPGQGLPKEVMELYEQHCSHLKEEESSSTKDEGAPKHRGIAGIVYGAPLIDTSSIAVAMADHYGGLRLSIDAVVTDALMNGTSPVSLKARELYERSAVKREEKRSMEADLLVDILVERFQQSDCCDGIVIDGLASVFTCSRAATLQAVLKALNSYKHIYVINLHDTYSAMNAREIAQKCAEEALQKEEADKEAQWLQSLDDDQSRSLSNEVRTHIIQQHVEKLRQKKLRELERARKEMEEKEEKERMKRLQEEELLRAKKARKKNDKDPTKKKVTAETKEPAPTQGSSPPNNSKELPQQTGQPSPSAEGSAAPVQKKEAAHHPHKPAEETKHQEDAVLMVDERQSQFTAYQKSCDQVEHILQHWDLARGLLLVPLPDALLMHHDGTSKRQIPVAKNTAKGRDKTSASSAEREKAVIIPHIVVHVDREEHLKVEELLRNTSLPALHQPADEAGVEPISPPTPPSTIFSVVPYPKIRDEVVKLTCDCFTFLRPSTPEDQVEKDESVEEVRPPASKASAVPLRSPSRASTKETARGRDSRSKRRPVQRVSPQADVTSVSQQSLLLDTKRKQSLTSFRWIVPTQGEVVLKIWFYSELPGTFAQTFNFEVMGTRRSYQLPCRGICIYPSICRNHMTLFPTCKKVEHMSDKVQKAYVTDPGYFEFGPLLCSKTRDRYRDRYPENTEKVVIHNNSGLQAEVQFRFQDDDHAATFLLDPPAMSLKPDQKKELTVWAYPTKVGQMKDSVIISVQDSSEPFSIDVSCWGVRPELKLESKHFHFDRIILHREDSRSIVLYNKVALPVSWRLHGIEDLGDEFSVPQSDGIIAVGSSFPLSLHFKARRPLHVRKILRLEVSDAEKILGIVHSENLLVTAEAYDVALELSPEGCLNFGTLKVFEENKLVLKIKNQGKYDIAFNFLIQQTAPTLPDLASIFTVCPQSGILKTHDKATILQIFCRPNTEFSLREKPVLSCQVIEPKIGDGGEVIAMVAINVSVTSVFSRYKVTPVLELNFGPLAYGCKKSQSFAIENTGALETRFKISGMVAAAAGKKTPQERTTGFKARRESVTKDPRSAQSALSMGVFSVTPSTGALQAGSQQVVTVHCAAEQLGVWNQGLLIDIIDRDPTDHPDGIPYRLLAEVCKPKHYICCNSGQLSLEPFCSAECVYTQDENRFIFQKVPVGQTVTAQFKLSNNSKVSCTLMLAIRTTSAKERPLSHNTEVFELIASTLIIPSQSYSFASVSFTPQMMQVYGAVLEATVEQSARLTPTLRSKLLEFNLTGEGVLPHVSVLCPAVRNSAGSPMMHFRRVHVGERRTLPLVLINNGYFPVQAQVDLLDEHDMFALTPSLGNTCRFIDSTPLEGATDSEHPAARSARMSLDVNEQVRLEVSFCSNRPVRAETRILMCLEDNKHVTTTIQVRGEACQDVVSFHNINNLQQTDLDVDEGDQEVLNFGGCYVDRPYQQSFVVTNHSSSQVFKFEWPHVRHVCVSPQVGHLHAGCSKEVTVSFCSSKPVRFRNRPVSCKLCEVAFDQPVEEVADWDDRQRPSRHSSATQQITGGDPEEPEPPCSVVEGSQREMNLCVSAVCDYTTFSCSTDGVHFEDTELYRRRRQQFQISNDGMVKLEFSFQLFLDPGNSQDEDGSSAEDEQQLAPISIEPRAGVIEAGKIQVFNVDFSPVKVSQYQGRLVCSIPNLQKDQAPCVSVSGRSLLALYHFYLEDSDFISRLSSNSEFTGRLDADTTVLGFDSIAFVPSIRCFDILNPTKDSYSFTWRCEDSGSSPFHCLHPCGRIPPGKTLQARFEYLSEKASVVHSSWSFVIEPLSLSVPFMCVGITREPQLYFSKRQIDFGELPVGCRVQQLIDLVNCEEEAFPFAVLQSSLLCEDQTSSLKLEPPSAVLPPKTRLSLAVNFAPCCKGEKRFRVVLRMKKKPEPLVLTVKASCLPMSTSLQLKMPDGVFRQVNPEQEETLDFGEVVFRKLCHSGAVLKMEISEKSFFYFLLTNQSKFSMDVTFELAGSTNLLQHLRAEPPNAAVDVGAHLQTSLLFSPKGFCNLQDVKLRIKVKLGPTFNFVIKGRCSAPSLEFSFSRHNFGQCLLYRPEMVLPSTTLVISNTGKKDVGLQCQFRNTPYLELDFGTNVLSPGGVLDVPIRFLPRELSYHEKVTFVLNSCITKDVSVLGQGVKMKLEVEDPRQRKLNLGSVNSGQRVKKKVKLVNRSTIDLSFKLLLNTQLDPRDLSLSHTGELHLRAGGSCSFEILFSPHQRLAAFTAELLAECAGVFYPLLTLQGSCPGMEVQLDQNHLAFGAVVQHCQASKKIIMTNTGDVGTRSTTALTITPAKGFIRPGTEVLMDVTFAPVKLSEDIRCEVSCAVGSSCVLKLTVTGSCVMVSTNKEVVQFACPVRGSHTQMLQVTNPTYQQCRIEPVLKGGQWSIAPFLDFEPLQSKAVELSYQPMAMTVGRRENSGSVFFSFPDGSGTMFTLKGTAEPPKVEDTITCQQPAKTQQTVVLSVHNWLSKKQQFRVLMEILKPDRPDATVSIGGLPFIDVPALATKDYRMSFFAYREGQFLTKVTFQNATSGEYLFYLVSFENLAAGPLSTLELVATVREKVSASVTVENPLSKATCLTTECKCPEISTPSQHTVPGESKGSVSFEYRPLHARPSTVRLTLHSPELGHFHYDLSLRALPAPPEKILHFSAALGRSHMEAVKFLNYSHVKAEYSCWTDSPDFSPVAKLVSAPPGYRQPSEAVVSVCFEPHQLGEVRGLLTLSSENGGSYTFVLRGTCIPPQAQGPFNIKPGRSFNIPFKNVFLQSTTFSFQVNNPCFVVKGFVPTMEPKKTQNVIVYFEVPAGTTPGACCGTLTVSCQATDSHSIPFLWDYYLQGSSPE
eukprot:XP_011617251.1 PREDICTED: hydrocephalus-inducing protein homolog [Takifugu rubripes]